MGKANRKGGRSKMTAAEKAAATLARAKPNPRTSLRQDRFRHFMGDAALGYEMSCAGRLMIVGGFDGLDADPIVALSALISYQNAYWGNYPDCQPLMSDYQREVRGRPVNHDNSDRRGEWFDAIDRTLRDEGEQVRRAVHDITVDRHWFPDEDCEWVGRIINRRVMDKRDQFLRRKTAPPAELFVVGRLAVDSDWAMLELARRGAMALAGGQKKRAA